MSSFWINQYLFISFEQCSELLLLPLLQAPLTSDHNQAQQRADWRQALLDHERQDCILAQQQYGPLSLSILQHMDLDVSNISNTMLLSAALDPEQLEPELHWQVCQALR